MANAKRCDKCGGFYIPTTSSIVHQKLAVSVLEEWRSWERLDFCDNCYEELQEFLRFDNADKEDAKDADSN